MEREEQEAEGEKIKEGGGGEGGRGNKKSMTKTCARPAQTNQLVAFHQLDSTVFIYKRWPLNLILDIYYSNMKS